MLKFYVKVFYLMSKAPSGAIMYADRFCCLSSQWGQLLKERLCSSALSFKGRHDFE